MKIVVQITLQDGLMFPSGFIAPASYSCILFCRVPADWAEGNILKAEKLETVFEELYGKTWRSGNDDGSQYVVRSVESRVLSPTEEESAPWQGVNNSGEYRYWFYHVSAAGEFQKVEPSEF